MGPTVLYWCLPDCFRATIYRQSGDITMAIVNFTQAIKLDKDDYEAYYQRAEMYEKVSRKNDCPHFLPGYCGCFCGSLYLCYYGYKDTGNVYFDSYFLYTSSATS